MTILLEAEIDTFEGILGCAKESWPLKYLGLPFSGNPRSTDFWNPIVEKMTKRLSSWKKNYISLGGRIALIKSTLSNLPTYYLSIVKAPISVIKSIEKL